MLDLVFDRSDMAEMVIAGTDTVSKEIIDGWYRDWSIEPKIENWEFELEPMEVRTIVRVVEKEMLRSKKLGLRPPDRKKRMSSLIDRLLAVVVEKEEERAS